MTQAEALLLLREAQAEPVGLLLTCSEPEIARQRLYKAKREALDPGLDVLQLRIVDLDGGNLAIVKGRAKS